MQTNSTNPSNTRLARWTSSVTLTLSALAFPAAVASGLASGLAVAAPAAPVIFNGEIGHVYVYNGGANNEGKQADLFANAAQGWIFQEMGLLDANGKPPTVVGDDLKHGATTVGTVIRDANNKIIGYKTSNGKKACYNVDAGATTRQAWEALAPNGTFVIAKHGSPGGITLDNGKSYDGFKEDGSTSSGTGRGTPQGPYPLPPKPGGNVTFYANSCNSANDPPGATGSVTGSAGNVGGVTGTQGNPGLIYKGTWLTWTGGTGAQQDAALDRLKAKAKAAGMTTATGEGDAGKWLASLPFPSQHSTIEATIAGTGATFRLEYTKSPNAGFPGNATTYYTPVELVDPSGGSLFHQNGPGEPSLELIIPPLSIFTGLETVQLMPDLPIDLLMPRGIEPASYFGTVHQYGLDPTLLFDLAHPALLRLSFHPTGPVLGVFELLPNGSLQPVPSANIQPGMAEVQIVHNGTWVVLQQSLGTIFCPANPNSSGQAGRLDASGSPFLVDNQVVLTASQLPPFTFGFVIASQQQGFLPNAGGSMGNLCLLPPIGRGVGHLIFNSGPIGMGVVEADLNAMPTPNGPVPVQPGETWNFQAWHRDATQGGQTTSNFTDAVSITFQ